MNQRESSGLPLRAMVMVLLFLGVVFLLVALQAMGGGSDDADSSIATTTTTTTTTTEPPAEPARAEHQLADDQQRPALADELHPQRRATGVVVPPLFHVSYFL